MSQAYKCDRCGCLFEVNLITNENRQKFEIADKLNLWNYDLCGNCQRAFEEFMEERTFSPDEVDRLLVLSGQKDTKRFKLGETIMYSPSEVCNILKGVCKNDT